MMIERCALSLDLPVPNSISEPMRPVNQDGYLINVAWGAFTMNHDTRLEVNIFISTHELMQNGGRYRFMNIIENKARQAMIHVFKQVEALHSICPRIMFLSRSMTGGNVGFHGELL
jgi:hypothetical protein